MHLILHMAYTYIEVPPRMMVQTYPRRCRRAWAFSYKHFGSQYEFFQQLPYFPGVSLLQSKIVYEIKLHYTTTVQYIAI